MPSAPRPRLTDLLAAGVGIRSVALSALLLLATLYTLYFAQAVILPVVLAIILSLLLAPLVRTLHQRLRIPPGLGAAVVMASLIAVVAGTAALVIEPASAWVQTVPERVPEIQRKLRLLQQPFEKVQEASAQVEQLADMAPADDDAQVVKIHGGGPASLLMTQTPAFVANLFVMFILIYFMLASGDLFLRKLVRMIPSFPDKRRTVEIAHEIEDRISRYLRTITLINAGLGVSVGLAAHFTGMPSAPLWGVLAAVLNYVPYLGGLLGISAALLVSLLSFESTLAALLFPAIYLALNTLEGNFITPVIVSRILTLNPVVVFVAIMFWGWLWGIPGALLAVPLLAIFKIVCDHLRPLAPIGQFVGGEPDDPTPEPTA